jgi:gliding motility-associated lipoprotein GldD
MKKEQENMRYPKIKIKYPALFITSILLLSMVIVSCKDNYTPKPRSYFRIDFPEKKYVPYHQNGCNYSFEIPVYARVVPFVGNTAEPCWINIEFPGYKGILHLTYKPITDNLGTYLEDIRTLAYKHSIKADDIIERPFSFPERDVNGILYDIKGNTASSLSFFVTDSTKNFLSGALYFNVIPNKDSLAPVIQFFSADIEHLIETLYWN